MPDSSPRALELIQSLAGTATEDDPLRTREDAARWLREAGLLPEGGGVSNSEHAALLRLRDSLRDMFAAHAAGREDAGAAARLTRALVDGRLVLTVDRASTVRLASAARASYPNIVAAIAIAIAEASADGTWPGRNTTAVRNK
jgi:hypothetical protein